jgi:hypothetical protein
LSATIGAVYDCALDPVRWTMVMGELATLLGASRAFLGVSTPKGETSTIVAAPGYSAADFTTPEMALNPIVPLGLTYPPDAAFVASRDYGLPQLQAILGIAVATVRSHLSSLFHRTGTACQAELVARTLSLASLLRPRQER